MNLIHVVLPDGRHERYIIDLAALWREIDALQPPSRSHWDYAAVMHARYTDDGQFRRTLDDIAAEYGVTCARIQQIVWRAAREVRHPRRIRNWATYKG